MILNEDAVRNMAKQAANLSGKRQSIYRRKSGESFFGPDGTLIYLRNQLHVTDATYVDTIYPDGQEPIETDKV